MSSANGYNFYITEDDYILPTQRHEVVYVPVITGIIYPPFGRDYVGSWSETETGDEKKVSKNYVFFSNLINFCKIRERRRFLELVYRSDRSSGRRRGGSPMTPKCVSCRVWGNQVIMLGSLDHYPEKLERLMRFYRKGMAYESWDRYRYIDVRYAGQVVCTP